MTRFFATACRGALCIALQAAVIGSAAAESATEQASQVTAMISTQTAKAGAAIRRFIGPPEARALWDDPQIKALVNEMENAWDFETPDRVPGFGWMPEEQVREHLRRLHEMGR